MLAKMIHWSSPKIVLIGCALIISILNAQSCVASRFLPDQLHCESDIYYQNTDAKKTISQYLVQEFVDFDEGRSSLEVQDAQTGEMSIYYNELGPASLPRRKFLVYDFATNTCRKTTIQDWPLKRIRKILLNLLPMDKIDRPTCDIALGPSAILVAIEQCQDDFHFVQQKFSDSYLTKVDIYERVIQEVDFTGIVTLRVVSQNRAQAKMQESSLTNATSYGQLDFLSATICEVSHDRMKDRRVGVEYECEESELVLDADYHLVAQQVSGSLLGRTLEESSNFDFRRDPYMRPLGIGCWRDYDLSGRKHFIIPSQQFSAEYVTSNGSSGSTYVAYDGYRRLLRLDREERKSIYDLDRAVSYHTRSSSPVREVSDSSSSSASDAAQTCVVLPITDQALLGTDTMERLMGLGSARLTHYMGSRMVDHVAYDVFELELIYDDMGSFEFPIFMEPTGYVARRSGGASGNIAGGPMTRYFLDFYLHDDEGTADKMGTYRDQDSRTTLSSSMVPKFVELWEVDGSGEKSLVNRLEFIEFMWSLEVQPEGDWDTQDMSHIFYAKNCIQSRSTSWLVRFQVDEDADRKLSPSESAAFRANKQLLREELQNIMASTLDISRLRIAKLDLAFLPQSTNLLAEAQVVRLQTSTFQDRLRGYVSFMDTMNTLKDHVKAFKYNRHSMESCKLDSLTGQVSGKTSLMFCRGLTICVIFERATVNSRLESKDIVMVSEEPIEALRSSNPLVAKCELRESDWFANMEPDPEFLEVRMLNNEPLQVRFRYVEPSQQTKFAVYRGLAHDTVKKRLDSVGLATIAQARQAPLVGLRHTTVQEVAKALNLNIPIKLDSSLRADEKFGYCQLSCQFDEYCQSFSVCLGKKSSANDCILSTLSLTGARVESLAQKLRSNASDDELEFRLATTNGDPTEVFQFRRQSECNIHPRDIVSSYQLFSSFNLTKPSKQDQKEPTDQQQQASVLTLEDCAAQSFREKISLNLINANFTYCPLSSSCVTNKPIEATHTSVARGQLCSLYVRNYVQFYKYRSNTHMAILVDNGTATTTTPAPVREAKDSLISHPMVQTDIGRTIEGLGAEECARDCNLFHSNCLAFDSCHPKGLGTSLCIMYPIKSPASADGYIAKPEDSGADNKPATSSIKAKLVTNFACEHFALKGSYLDIKLRQMSGDKIVDLPQRSSINKLEDSIIDEDQRRGDETMRDALERATASGSSGKVEAAAAASNFHFILFLLGSILACAGFIGAGGAPVWVMDHWERLRARLSPRHRGHRISQLALASDEP